jgi:hypothetical protein
VNGSRQVEKRVRFYMVTEPGASLEFILSLVFSGIQCSPKHGGWQWEFR